MRCRICKVPLKGIMAKITKALFKVGPSEKDASICNKCAANQEPQPQKIDPEKIKDGQYTCHICNRLVDEDHALTHIKAEEYLLDLIRKDHPQWKDKDPLCKECIEYYRKLIKDAEI